MKTELVIFDLDGTLLDTIGDLAASCNHTLLRNGFVEHPIARYRQMVGGGITKLIERALPEECHGDGTLVAALRNDFIEYYSAHIADLTKPYDGIPELLEELHSRSIGLAVASNKFIEGTQYLVGKFFHQIDTLAVEGQRDGVAVKPDTAMVENIIAHFGVDRRRILYVGDSGVDMQTALNAGLSSVGVTWGFRSREELISAGAERLVDHPSEILPLVD